ncbi:MAG: polysaccharide deacetylase family protein [Candidatus Eisenbacteria bacterium]
MQRDSTSGDDVRTALRRFGSRVRNSPLVVGAMSAVPAEGAVILRYHSVNDDPGWIHDYVQRSLAVPPDVFDRQMRLLARHRTVVGIGDLADLARSRRRIDRRLAAVTFDDGYEDNYRHALPILRRHGLTAAFYVTTGSVDDATVLWTVRLRFMIRKCRLKSLALSFTGERALDVSTTEARENAIRLITGVVKRSDARDADAMLSEVEEACGVPPSTIDRRVMMNEAEIRGLHEAGMTVGSHTAGHYNLPSIETRDVATELGDSKEFLERVTGAPVDHFAYPDGRTGRHFDGRVSRLVAMAGYRSAVTSVTGPASSCYSEYSIPRLGVTRKHSDVRRLAADIQYARFTRPSDDVFDEVRSMSGGSGDGDGNGGGARPRPVRP